MSLPEFNELGELPVGIWPATIEETLARLANFGDDERRRAGNALNRIFELAVTTKHLRSILVFGSFTTTKPNPRDVDVVLLMDDDLDTNQCPADSKILFDHDACDRTFGASVFWIRPAFLIGDTMDEFRARWQLTRDHRTRGIVEVLP
jgi:hypothetical protein